MYHFWTTSNFEFVDHDRLDYTVRAIRMEEIPLLAKAYEEYIIAEKNDFLKMEEQMRQAHKKEFDVRKVWCPMYPFP